MDCEICGKREAVCMVFLEGANMGSCPSCSRGGKILYYFSTEEDAPVISTRPVRTEEEITESYGKKIKEARIRLGLTLEELGMKIAEKSNYLDHVEREVTLPSLPLARKLEKFLKITLVEAESVQQGESKAPYGKKELTLMDVVEIERREDKKSNKKKG